MTDSPVPAYVDTRKIFLQRGAISGTIALQRLIRFSELLANNSGSVYVELEFFNDESGRHRISGHLHTEVAVVCQRCMEPLEIVLDDDIELAVLKDESKVASLDAEFDPWICSDTKLEITSLVEEQLILCLPIVSLHDSANCNGTSAYLSATNNSEKDPATGTVNPFAALKSLKSQERNK